MAIKDYSSTAADNTAISGISIQGTADVKNFDNAMRQQLADIANWTDSDTLASASTTDLGSVEGMYVSISGTTTITAFGTLKAGMVKFVKFDGALTLTHNATSLILPGAANITTAAGDAGVFVSEGSGNWRCVGYCRAAAVPLQFATKALQESGTDGGYAVPPSVQQHHPSAAKAWARVTQSAGSYTLTGGYNIDSVTKNSTGNLTVNFATDFASSAYACVVSADASGVSAAATSLAAGSVVVRVFDATPTAFDAGFHLIAFGTQ